MFRDRTAAGCALAERLEVYRDRAPIVLALPRGGLPVAAEVARHLEAPLDVIVVRKLGLPGHEELAMGAIGEGGARVINEPLIRAAQVSNTAFAAVERRERAVLDARVRALRARHRRLDVAGRLVIVVDDGLATGATARAAIAVARQHGAAKVVLAIPVAAPDSVEELRAVADDLVAVEMPRDFAAVGQWYADFSPVNDRDVVRLLDAAARPKPASRRVAEDREVSIRAGAVALHGTFSTHPGSLGIVIFAHGSGSSRHSGRNVAVARVLQQSGFDTLLFDLLTEEEAGDRRNVFDVEFLAGRLRAATNWVRDQPEFQHRPVGYFGASTGAAAALVACAQDPDIAAVVSRGGRPDLAGHHLAAVRAPTLLVVGSRDEQVLELNRLAARELRGVKQVSVVAGATHLFEEPGTLLEAARLAVAWFHRWLSPDSRPQTAATGMPR